MMAWNRDSGRSYSKNTLRVLVERQMRMDKFLKRAAEI